MHAEADGTVGPGMAVAMAIPKFVMQHLGISPDTLAAIPKANFATLPA
jgi:hypothetical protein